MCLYCLSIYNGSSQGVLELHQDQDPHDIQEAPANIAQTMICVQVFLDYLVIQALLELLAVL